MITKYIFIFVGSICLSIAIIGYLIPPIPATPFLLLAAFCFSKTSPKIYQWILARKHIGPLIQNYIEHQVLSPKIKLLSSVFIVIFAIFFSVYVFENIWILLSLVVFSLLFVVIILLHPSKVNMPDKK